MFVFVFVKMLHRMGSPRWRADGEGSQGFLEVSCKEVLIREADLSASTEGHQFRPLYTLDDTMIALGAVRLRIERFSSFLWG